MASVHEQTFTNLAGHPTQPGWAFRPSTLRELRDTVAGGAAGGLIPRGYARTAGDCSLNQHGGLVHVTGLNRLLGFDTTQRVVQAEAGVTIQSLLDTFLPRGFVPPVVPATARGTLGGLIACDGFGPNQHLDGSIAEHLRGLTVMLADGTTATCSRDEDPELFRATVGGMGLTGVIIDATLRLVRVPTAYVAVDSHRANDLSDLLDLFESRFIRHRYATAWVDVSGASLPGRGVVMFADVAKVSDLPDGFMGEPLRPEPVRTIRTPFRLPIGGSQTAGQWATDLLFMRNPSGRRVMPFSKFFCPTDAVEDWHRVYGKGGFRRFEAIVPFEQGREAMATLVERLASSDRVNLPAMVKPMGVDTGGHLSFASPGWMISVDLPNYDGVTRLIQKLDQAVLAYGGRRALPSDTELPAGLLERMYPRLQAFRAVKARVDPADRFASSWSRRMGVTP